MNRIEMPHLTLYRQPISGVAFSLLAVLIPVLLFPYANGHAQDLEPRAYSNTPVGMNFLLIGYGRSDGALLFDPELPVTDANAKVDQGFLGYVRALGIADKSAKVGILLPIANLDANGFVDGEFVTRDVSGLGDPSFYFTINLFGAPALSIEEFRQYQQDTIIGLTFKLTAPLGEYDNEKLLNIGTNRWSFKSELGLSQAIRRWTLEAAVAAVFYTDNDEFFTDNTRKQDPIYSLQGHAIYTFPRNIWAAVSVTYFAGGRTAVEGVTNNDLQQNWRTGFTLAFPVNRNHSVKLFGNSGVSTRTGNDYDLLGIAWQYRWGRGF
ncbi:MAG: transporter [Thiotrichales bacterium]|nr:MAG: transporter [Thiotrichales bacterium]